MAILFADSFNGYPTQGVSPAPSGGNVNGWQDMVNAGYEKPGNIGGSGWFSAGVCKNGGKIGNSCRMALRINTSGTALDGLPSTEFMLSRKIPVWERFIALNVQLRLTKSYAASSNSEKLPLVTLGPITVYAQNAMDAGISMYNVFVNNSGIVGRFDSSMWHGLEVEVNREAKKLRVYIGNMPVWESDATEFEVSDFRFRGYIQTSTQHLGYIDLDSLVLQDGSGTKNNARIAALAVTAMQPSAAVQEQFGEKYPVQATLVSALTDTSSSTGYTFENSYVSSDVLGVRDLVKTETLPEVFKPLSVVVNTASRRSEPDSMGIKPVVKYKDLIYKGITPFNVGAWRTDRFVLDSAPDGADWNGQSVLDLAWGYETVSKAEDPPLVNGGFDYLIFGGAGTVLDIYKGGVDPTYINPSPPEYVPGPITIENSGPGSKVVGKGTRALGYFGSVTNDLVFPDQQLHELFPLTEGTAINQDADWLKFVNGGKVLFIAKKPLRTDISWRTLYQAGLVYGVNGTGRSPMGDSTNQLKIVKSGGFKYRLRLIQGADANPSGSLYNVPDPIEYRNSEWTRLLMRVSEKDPSATFWERFTDDDLGHTDAGGTNLSWCYETHPYSVGNHRVSRGYPDITGVAATEGTATSGGGLKMAWRPCLEYIGVDDGEDEEIEAPLPPVGVPGGSSLLFGTEQLGYFGRVSSADMLQGNDPATLVGLTQGTAINSGTEWLKFAYQGKILFVPRMPLRSDISYAAIYAAGAVYGTEGFGVSPLVPNVKQNKKVTIGANQFSVRLFQGADTDPSTSTAYFSNDPVGTKNSEWTQLMSRVWASNPNGIFWERFTDAELGTVTGGKNMAAWTQELVTGTPYRVVRNHPPFLGYSADTDTSIGVHNTISSWWPVFELVPNTTPALTIFDSTNALPAGTTNNGSVVVEQNKLTFPVGGYLSIQNNPALAIGTSDFKIDFDFTVLSVNPVSGGAVSELLFWGTWAAPGQPLNLEIGYNHIAGTFHISCSHSDANLYRTFAFTLALNTAYEVSFIRSAGTLYLYVNGRKIGEVAFPANLSYLVNAPILIGRRKGGTSGEVIWNSNMEVRSLSITKS